MKETQKQQSMISSFLSCQVLIISFFSATPPASTAYCHLSTLPQNSKYFYGSDPKPCTLPALEFCGLKFMGDFTC